MRAKQVEKQNNSLCGWEKFTNNNFHFKFELIK